MAASDTPSQSNRKLTYDVFLSFRGEDTRKNFVDHLYDRLNLKGLHTFKDDERLEKGQQIAPALLQSIQESRFAVVVFSKNYASSTWCLDELAKIMECKENLNQVVVPIFCDIEPSHVRKQTGSFEEAFAKHEENEGKGRVERWRKALTEAGSIAGHDLQGDEYNGYELKCIKAVSADISKLLPSPSVEKGLVGLESRLKEIRMKLEVWDEDVKLVLGLWGMGGIGKTTIARVAFDQFSSEFDGSCFLADVRKHGLEALQKKLLSKVLKENSIDIDDVNEGIRMIHKRLKWKKVLIVLDDVDNEDQLEKLVGDGKWLCNGSRVIITTRDKHLFTQFTIVVETYEVKKLEKEKALELFSWHAFKKESPENGFENLSKSFVTHASGLPLALKVWGSSLRGQTNKKMWKSKLEMIKDIPDENVIEKLKISYEGLCKVCKKVFLDIVCFFRDERLDIVKEVLNGCKLYPDTNISLLIDRCLLFESHGFIHMHDLIHEMGLSIESKERSRRWQLDDLNDEPMAVEGLLLSFDCDESISPCIDSFKQMTKLQMLLVKYQENYHCRSESHLESIEAFKETGIMNYLPRNLMVLKFPHYPWSNPFCPMEMKKLTYLDLSSSNSLLETPNFAKMLNLVNLNLSGCGKLKTIHTSIGNLKKLVKLNLRKCSNLGKFPSFNQEMKSITHLDLSHCRSLSETPNFFMMPNLEYLLLSKCEKLKEIHSSLGNLTELVELDFDGCSNLEKLPSFNQEIKSIIRLDIKNCSSLLETPNFAMMPNLKYFGLSMCEKLKEIHPSLGNLTELVKLDFDGCSNIEKLPSFNQEIKRITCLDIRNCSSLLETPNFAMMPNLEYLQLSECEKLKEIHPSFGNLAKLVEFDFDGCTNLEKFPSLNQEIKSITRLDIRNCRSLLETPNFAMMPNLKYLWLSKCEKLKEIHPSLGNLTELVELDFDGCSNLEKLPRFNQEIKSITDLDIRNSRSLLETPNFAMMPNLEYIGLSNCEKLKGIHPSLGNLTKLVKFDFDGCCNLEKFPIFNQEIKSITRLDIRNCSSLLETPNFAMMPNLEYLLLSKCEKLKGIHPSLRNLTELVELDFFGCSNLQKFPNFNQEIKSITRLDIRNCSSLLETPNFAMMPNLEYLLLSGCEKLKEIHPSLGNLKELVEFDFDGCSNLEKLPSFNQEIKSITRMDIRNCSSLLETPNFAMMPNLEYLLLSKCEKLKDIHPSLGNLTELVKLVFDGCSNHEKLPSFNQEIKSITRLDIKNCSSLLETQNFAMMPNLKYLELSNCEKLKEIHPSLGNLTEFVKLVFDGCSNHERLPSFNQEIKSITRLDIRNCSSLFETPNFAMMPNLKYLVLSKCEKLKEIHPSLGNLTELVKLVFDGCSNLKKLPSFNQETKSISCLNIRNCSSLLETPNFAMMPNLKYLDLSKCEELKEIHPSLGNLTELVELVFDGCSNLEMLPIFNQEMKSITSLNLRNFSSLL
ncbi:PREDICTED: TMV resistance protein N-like isoform X2 [Ipomoea nil]|uniref:TMV resistance protein N-like isoform X2 n=1 Tax=Ipomoea nil TaxID=35883 RepID=UPI000901B3BF|nr:PREDICTED: TMV resistance protein N-like isoform X2 [Ipomoea nil]